MGDRFKDADRTALAGVSHSPPHRKAYSYSQQLRTNTGCHIKRHPNHPRNHSLDEIDILVNHQGNRKNAFYDGNVNSSDEEDFYRYSSGRDGSASDHQVDYHRMTDGMGKGDSGPIDESQQAPNQPLPEFTGSGGGMGVFKVPFRAAVHPNRPPCLELRPHPLRETQVGFKWPSCVCLVSFL